MESTVEWSNDGVVGGVWSRCTECSVAFLRGRQFVDPMAFSQGKHCWSVWFSLCGRGVVHVLADVSNG